MNIKILKTTLFWFTFLMDFGEWSHRDPSGKNLTNLVGAAVYFHANGWFQTEKWGVDGVHLKVGSTHVGSFERMVHMSPYESGSVKSLNELGPPFV